MSLFNHKYRIESTRLKSWDYSSEAAYFITICTRQKEHFFGEIVANELQETALGVAARNCWHTIPEHFPFVELDSFVVMPNHVHGILVLNRTFENQNKQEGNIFGPQSKNLGSIIRGYKIGVTKYATNNNLEFGWQPRYYDNIIRNEAIHLNIQNYIAHNPQRWVEDKFYTAKNTSTGCHP